MRTTTPIDSSHDAPGTRYQALVLGGTHIGNLSITPGSQATLTIAKAADGSLTLQLISVTLIGQEHAVGGTSPTITGAAAKNPKVASKTLLSGAAITVPANVALSFTLAPGR